MKFENISVEELVAELKPPEPETVKPSPLPTKEYHVVDPETGQVIGTIDAPLAFCVGVGCPGAAGKRNPMGFVNPLNRDKDPRELWLHEHCFRPTRQWWDSTWHGLVVTKEGVALPWRQDSE